MMRRYVFYIILGGLGLISSIGQWLMFQCALPGLHSPLGLMAFLLMPFTYIIPNLLERYFPSWFNRGVVTFGGYWLLLTYFATILLVIYFFLWLVFQIGIILSINTFWDVFDMSLWPHISFWYSWFSIVVLIALLVKAIYTATYPIMKHIDIFIPVELQREYTVAFASDLHFGMVLGKSFGRRLVRHMNALSPDVILFGGDLIDGNLHSVLRENSFDPLKELQPRLGTYAVFGNHDHYCEDLPILSGALARVGVKTLTEDTVVLEELQIFGMNDGIFYPNPTIPHCMKEYVGIVIEHEPIHITEVRDKGFHVFLAGHTHGGQFWPNRFFTKRMFPLDYGMKKFKQLYAVVSSGYGAWGALFRLGIYPEILVLHIKREK